MTARLLWFAALIATMITGSMAFQCYERMNGTTTTKVTCASSWCIQGTLKSGKDGYACDPTGACALLGKTCIDSPADKVFKSVCCCNSNLCNSATLHIQSLWLGVISLIVSMMLSV